VFGDGKPQAIEEIPGRALELRLLKLGVDPWDDCLTNKTFHRSLNFEEEFAFIKPTPTNNYPQPGNFQGSYAYAMSLIAKREWADAARHLVDAAAVPEGTAEGVWEFQIQITLAWTLAMTGDFPKAKTTMEAALAKEHQCEVPIRARFLSRLLGNADHHLSPEFQAALPND